MREPSRNFLRERCRGTQRPGRQTHIGWAGASPAAKRRFQYAHCAVRTRCRAGTQTRRCNRQDPIPKCRLFSRPIRRTGGGDHGQVGTARSCRRGPASLPVSDCSFACLSNSRPCFAYLKQSPTGRVSPLNASGTSMELTIAINRYDRHVPFFNGTVDAPKGVSVEATRSGRELGLPRRHRSAARADDEAISRSILPRCRCPRSLWRLPAIRTCRSSGYRSSRAASSASARCTSTRKPASRRRRT